jgi:hypothetical protein
MAERVKGLYVPTLLSCAADDVIFSRFQEASALLPGCPTLIHEGISTEEYAMNTARKFEAFLGKGDTQYGRVSRTKHGDSSSS